MSAPHLRLVARSERRGWLGGIDVEVVFEGRLVEAADRVLSAAERTVADAENLLADMRARWPEVVKHVLERTGFPTH